MPKAPVSAKTGILKYTTIKQKHTIVKQLYSNKNVKNIFLIKKKYITYIFFSKEAYECSNATKY